MKKKRSRQRPAKQSLFPSILTVTCVFLLLLGLLFGINTWKNLEKEIAAKFEGKRWSVPATIYARPLELYPGIELSPDLFARELELAGYRREKPVKSGGGYYRQGSTFHLVTRDFVFASGLEKSAAITVRFQGRTVADIRDTRGNTLPIVRIDPARIGSIHPLIHEDRVILTSEEIPQLLRDSLISVEDRNFYGHHGVSPTGIARAMLANIKAGKMVQGGSTLTQQLVKNFFLTRERTLTRKAQEAVMALIVDSRYSKEEILTAYINEVFLGQDGSRAIHGFGLASQFYFRRELQDLSIAQVATLVGMVKGPSIYDPRRNPENCLARRKTVLGMLLAGGNINQQQYDSGLAEPLTDVAPPRSGSNRFPAFVELVKRQLREEYREEDLKSEGLRILTTLDPQLQWQMEEQVQKSMASLKQRAKTDDLQLAMIITGREDGEVLALMGDAAPAGTGFNRALDARRPIGSLVKPAVYLTALSQGYTLATPLADTPISLKSGGKQWQPQNYDKQSHGTVALYRALAKSYNLATVNLGLDVGLEKVIATIRDLGYGGILEPYPALLLGAPDMTPLAVSQLFQTIASGGFYVPLRSIQSVIAQDGQLLTRYGLEVEQRFPPELMFVLHHALERVFTEGTASSRNPAGELRYAGKTGTSNDLRDSWFAGFSSSHTAVTWIGRDDNGPTGLSGSSGALVVWRQVLDAITSVPLSPIEPEGIVWARINTQTFEPATLPGSDSTLLPFVRGTEPQSIWSAPAVDMRVIEDTVQEIGDGAKDLWETISDMFR